MYWKPKQWQPLLKILPDIAYIDSCDVNPERYGERVAGFLSTNRPKRLSPHIMRKQTSLAVAAASILTKSHS